jgi:hypothetical protein
MMTQEFDSIVGAGKGTLPPGWIQIWNNPGGRHYYFNTLDFDIQYGMLRVLERDVLVAAAAKTEESSFNYEYILPAGVVPSYHTTISPFSLSSKRSGRHSSNLKMPAIPSKLCTCGGVLNILDTDDEESVSVTSVPVVPVALVARTNRKSQQPAKLQVNCPQKSIPKVMYTTFLPGYDNDSWEDSQDEMGRSEEYCPEVITQDLPNMDDFGAALALVNLHSEQPTSEFWEGSDEDYDNEK